MTNKITNKQLPNDFNLESKLLSFILANNEIITEANTKISSNDFFYPQHQKIYTVMNIIYRQGGIIDRETIAYTLGDDLKSIGLDYLGQLVIAESRWDGYEYVISKVKELSDRRKTAVDLMKLLDNTLDTTVDMKENIDMINDIANNSLKAINQGSHAMSMDELIAKTQAKIEENIAAGGNLIKGRASGITDLDLALGGFEDELIVIGARPSMGKTTLTVNLLRGLSSNYKCLFFSMEQKDTQLITKLISQDTKIDNRKIDRGLLDEVEKAKVYMSMSELLKLNLKIDERAGIGINEIESAIIREKQTNGLDVVCIDYLQYMDFGATENVNFAITKTVKRLKQISKVHKVCIILLSQLSRAPEQRADHHPVMSDLRDSGSVEQEADKILLLYRDVYYNPDTELKDILEINIAKSRNDATKHDLMLGFDLTRQLIYSLSETDKIN